MSAGKTIAFKKVRKYAKGGRVNGVNTEVSKDIKEMEAVLDSPHVSDSVKESVRASIAKAKEKRTARPA